MAASASIVPLTLDAAVYVTMRMRAADRAEILCQLWSDDLEALARHALACAEAGPAYACLDPRGEPVAIGGVGLRHPGLGVAWLWATDALPTVGVTVTRAARRTFAALDAWGRVQRIEAHSHDEHHEAHRWLAGLGFARRAHLERYGRSGEGFYLYDRVRALEAPGAAALGRAA